MRKFGMVLAVAMAMGLWWFVNVIGGSSITQRCPTNCPSSCTCYGNNCRGTAASCGGTVTCQCTDTNCFNSVECPEAPSCFLPGTLVNTKHGLKPIQGLKVGDPVLSLEGEKELRYNKVAFIYQTRQSGYFVINGTIKVTGSHPFFVNGRWVRVEDIKPGDKLLNKDLKPVVVKSIVRVNKPVRVYNFEVENAHNFFVQGILVHNRKQN